MTESESSKSNLPAEIPKKAFGPVPLPSAGSKVLGRMLEEGEAERMLARILEFYDRGASPRVTTKFANLLLEARGVPEKVRFSETDIVSFLNAHYNQKTSGYVAYALKGANEAGSVLTEGKELIRTLQKHPGFRDHPQVKRFQAALSRIDKRG